MKERDEAGHMAKMPDAVFDKFSIPPDEYDDAKSAGKAAAEVGLRRGLDILELRDIMHPGGRYWMCVSLLESFAAVAVGSFSADSRERLEIATTLRDFLHNLADGMQDYAVSEKADAMFHELTKRGLL